MARRRIVSPATKARVVEHHADTIDAADRMIGQLTEASERSAQVPRSSRVVDLVIGDNRVVTNLGRRAQGCSLTPTVASAAFAWAFTASGDKAATITVIGAAQPACSLEFW